PAEHRLRLSADLFIRDNVDWLVLHDTLPKHVRERYLDTALTVADIVDELMEGVPVHRIHGDLHLGNLLFRDGLLHVLDFDDMM
ncbi:MAG TPA: serine/threonine protein kinase, partial [Acidobacteria bacterium]|nr:serine/threonine protein kinase [Acidobacteriota bacterium]